MTTAMVYFGRLIAVIGALGAWFLGLGLMTDLMGVIIGGSLGFLLFPLVILFAPWVDLFLNGFWIPIAAQAGIVFGLALIFVASYLQVRAENKVEH